MTSVRYIWHACRFSVASDDRVFFVQPYKQARRREDDISIVTGGISVVLAPSASGGWQVRAFFASPHFCTPRRLHAAQSTLETGE